MNVKGVKVVINNILFFIYLTLKNIIKDIFLFLLWFLIANFLITYLLITYIAVDKLRINYI